MTHEGIKNGLALLQNQVIPSLFPFIFISNLLQNTISKTNSFLYIITGLLSGYPLGAKVIANTPLHHPKLSRQDLLLLCNLPGIAYVTGFIGVQCLHEKHFGILIYISILLGNIIYIISKYFICKILLNSPDYHQYTKCCSITPSTCDRAVKNTFHTLANLSTYILMFSILSVFAENIQGIPYSFRSIIIGICEMTNGIQQLCQTNLTQYAKMIIITGLTSFGGLSIFAQTSSMICHSDLSIKKYMTDKAIASIIAMYVMYGFTILYKICDL